MSYSVAVLNSIRDSASTEYQNRVPSATRTNMTAVGNAILDYNPSKNEFVDMLVNKIAKTIFTDKSIQNKLKIFKKGTLAYGESIEEIAMDLLQAKSFSDYTGDTTLKFEDVSDKIKVAYHKKDRFDTYKASLTDVQLRRAFTSSEPITALLDLIVKKMYESNEYDEYVLTKELLAENSANYFDYEVAPITSDATGKAFLLALKKAVEDVSFVSTLYNKSNIHTKTDKSDLVLLINKDVKATLDVNVLSGLFNLDKAETDVRIITVDDFGSMTDTYALLLDKDALMIYDEIVTTETQRNAEKMFTNIYLHVSQLYSMSLFTNAIRFKKVVA